MLARMKLDPARMELLAVFFETYLKLNREEEEQLYRELGKMDKRGAYYARSGYRRGRLHRQPHGPGFHRPHGLGVVPASPGRLWRWDLLFTQYRR
jgi:hypothetical protein